MAVTTLQLTGNWGTSPGAARWLTAHGFHAVGGDFDDVALPAAWFVAGTAAADRTLNLVRVYGTSGGGQIDLRFRSTGGVEAGPQLAETFRTTVRVTLRNAAAGDLILRGIGVGTIPDSTEPYEWQPSAASAEYTPAGGTRVTGSAATIAWATAATDSATTIEFNDTPPVALDVPSLPIALRLGTPDVFSEAPPLPASVDRTLVLSEANAGGVDRTNNFVRWTVASASSGFPEDTNEGAITLPESWFDRVYRASERTLNRVILRTSGVVQLHFGSSSASNIGPQLKAEFRDGVDVIVSEQYAGILTLHGIGIGAVPDTTEPYRWTPTAESAEHTQSDGSARRTGASAVAQFRSRYWFGGVDKSTLRFRFRRAVPTSPLAVRPLRIALRLGVPTLAVGPAPTPVTLSVQPLRIALALGTPTLRSAAAAPTPLAVRPLRIALRLGTPTLRSADTRPTPLSVQPLRIALRLGVPTLASGPAPTPVTLDVRPLRIALRLGVPDVFSAGGPLPTPLSVRPLAIALRLGTPVLAAGPAPTPVTLDVQPLRIALRLGTPTLASVSPGAVTLSLRPLRIALRLGTPTLASAAAAATPLSMRPLRIALALGVPTLRALAVQPTPLAMRPLRIALALGTPSFVRRAAHGEWPVNIAPLAPRFAMTAPTEVERVVYDDGAVRQARISSGGVFVRHIEATVAGEDLPEMERWLDEHAHDWFRFTDPFDGVVREGRVVGGVAGIEVSPETTSVGPVRWALSGMVEGRDRITS